MDEGNPRGHDPVHNFLLEAQSIVNQAQFIIDSFPNAELPAVERSSHQLEAIRQILCTIEDPHFTDEVRQNLLDIVQNMLVSLEDFISNPPPAPSTHLPKQYTGKAGRPRYVIDVQRVHLLHDLGNSYSDIAKAMGVSRPTLYNHLDFHGIPSARREFTVIDDDSLDEMVAEISLAHPFVGSVIISGHLEANGIHLPRRRVQESVKRVDSLGVLVRWANIIKRRVYRVRGANALWHHDGNEKLRPWGFYVHGCIDGHSRLIIYLQCCSNKKQKTVGDLFLAAVAAFGWPSRARGDFGTENNEVERLLIKYWGVLHRAYLRGRSRHNVRIERLWRDVRKDSLEAFRQIFDYLEKNDLLDMENTVHRTCLYLVFQPRIQQSLNRTIEAWNHHRLSSERDKTPIALYELSRQAAITRGYWTGDPGDPVAHVAADHFYGHDGQAPLPPPTEMENEPLDRLEQPDDADAQRAAGITLNEDDELRDARRFLGDFDCLRDDGNWGIEVYCEAVVRMIANLVPT